MPDTNPRKLPQLRVVESIEPNRVIETAHPTNLFIYLFVLFILFVLWVPCHKRNPASKKTRRC